MKSTNLEFGNYGQGQVERDFYLRLIQLSDINERTISIIEDGNNNLFSNTKGAISYMETVDLLIINNLSIHYID